MFKHVFYHDASTTDKPKHGQQRGISEVSPATGLHRIE